MRPRCSLCRRAFSPDCEWCRGREERLRPPTQEEQRAYDRQNRDLLAKAAAGAAAAFFTSAINASVAQLLARMPEALQEKATKELLKFPTGGEQVSQRRAFDFIQSRYMLSLEGAPFDVTDAELAPEAGACATCPKRTGNQRELFGDVASADVCTDPECFDVKKERVWQLRV